MLTTRSWDGRAIELAESRRGVLAVTAVEDNLVKGGVEPWPPPEIIQKLYRSNQTRAFDGRNQSLITQKHGYYCDLQSIHSEDAITWSMFGPLAYATPKERASFATWLMKKLDLPLSKATQAQICLWRRIPHPDTDVCGGPEVDVTVMTENTVIFGEAKWRSSIGKNQGKGKNKDQITLRKEFFEKHCKGVFGHIKQFVVLGISRDGRLASEESISLKGQTIFLKNTRWSELF